MAATVKGYRLQLIMPEHLSVERRASMRAYGAEVILVSKRDGMEGASDLALQMQAAGKGKVLDQFANPDNPRAHEDGPAPATWKATQGRSPHIVPATGTPGPTHGSSRDFKSPTPTVPQPRRAAEQEKT